MAPSVLHNPRTRARGSSDPSAEHSEPQQPSTLRRRPSLTSLYDDYYKQYIHDTFASGTSIVEPWKLEPAIELDTLPKAVEAYHYARYRLKHRYVTPRTEAFLEAYQKSLREHLDKPEDMEKKIEVRTMNKILHSKTILLKDLHPYHQPAAKAVEELAKLRYFADYGDYVAHVCTSFRQQCIAAKVRNVDILIGKSWGKVRDVLEEEDERKREWRRDPCNIPSPPPSPMSTTISCACGVLGLDYDNVRYCIEWYAARNDRAHSGVPFYIKNCDWIKLGRQLWQDLKEVPSVFGESDQRRMTKALEDMRDKFFFELTATSQVPTKLAQDLMVKKTKKDTTKMQNQRENIVKRREAERRRAAEAADKLKRKEELAKTAEGRKNERQSKSSGDCWENGEEDLGLGFF
ncbi:MAG: hypothetical protein L6R39_002620 [Caloplaca ligustica]|nr:MAG: hypothetical protein L6R39_002620 [Caloplaca ligustica]